MKRFLFRRRAQRERFETRDALANLIGHPRKKEKNQPRKTVTSEGEQTDLFYGFPRNTRSDAFDVDLIGGRLAVHQLRLKVVLLFVSRRFLREICRCFTFRIFLPQQIDMCFRTTLLFLHGGSKTK